MSASTIALTTIFIIVGTGVAIGFIAGASRRMDLEQWTVGGRGFGAVLMYLLMAGEVYTTFSFLGASGWAYSRGGPTLYILAYLTLAYVVSFYLLPPLWEIGREHGLQTMSDYFALRYGNKDLAAFVCIVGVVFLVPYVQLQLTGLGIIVSVASFDGISRESAMAASVVLLTAFVFVSGIRAVAWVSVLKDALMVIAAVSIGIGVPYINFGSVGAMFDALIQAKPGHLEKLAPNNLEQPDEIEPMARTSNRDCEHDPSFGKRRMLFSRAIRVPEIRCRRLDESLHLSHFRVRKFSDANGENLFLVLNTQSAANAARASPVRP